MAFLDFFFEREKNDKKSTIDPTKPLKGQLDGNQSNISTSSTPVDNQTEVYKNTSTKIEEFFQSLDTGKGSYHNFLKQVDFLKDVIPEKQILFPKAFQMLQKDGGDKYTLQQSAVSSLEGLKSEQEAFNQAITNKIHQIESQNLKDIDDHKRKIIQLEKEINATKLKLQELTANIAVTKDSYIERQQVYNEVSSDYQAVINSDLKDIQKFIN